MNGSRDSKDDYYRQRGTNGEVREVAHGDSGMQTSADLDDSGDPRFNMSGRPPQNEEGNESVARSLAEALTSQDGKQWTAEPHARTGRERGIDWYIVDPLGTRWPVQITRMGPEERWAESRRHGVRGGITSVDAAQEIADAIERKIGSQDERTILALSAGQPGYWIFDEVLAEFKRACLPDLQSKLRFAQIWLVGYSIETTLPLWQTRA